MGAMDDAISPAVRLGVRDRGMEDRTGSDLAMKLRAGNDRQRRLEGKAIWVGQPCGIIFEARALAAALLIVVPQPDTAGLVADLNANRAPHSETGGFGLRTRLGRRSTSSVVGTVAST